MDRVFEASLTELEASGLPVQSAQALATGRSVESANEEIARATAADVHLVAFDDSAYPARPRGVDTAAHRGAITGKDKTAAMFGTGFDVLYPKKNSRLAEQILSSGGALVSEFPLGTFAAPQNFPITQSHH